jgi:2-oxoacid dehydrogenase/acyltransferase catalytic subunit
MNYCPKQIEEAGPQMDRAIPTNSVRQAIPRPMVDQSRADKLSMPATEWGGFIISSLAQYDVTFLTAIPNPPQAGILNRGKTEQRLHLGQERRVRAKRIGVVGLGANHRISDGSVAEDFLQNSKRKVKIDTLSGACLNRACILTKGFLAGTGLFDRARRFSGFTGTAGLGFDLVAMARPKRAVVGTMVGGGHKLRPVTMWPKLKQPLKTSKKARRKNL